MTATRRAEGSCPRSMLEDWPIAGPGARVGGGRERGGPRGPSTCSRADAVGGTQGSWPPEEGLIGQGLLWDEEHKPPVRHYPGLRHLHQGPSTLPATEPGELS